MSPIDILTELFRKFPGVGGRQARRFAYFLLRQDAHYAEELARLISGLKKEMAQCSLCYRFFRTDGNELCDICRDPSRDHATLLVVERDTDYEAIKKSGTYAGMFFILGGTLPVLEENPGKRIRARELLAVVERRAGEGLSEIILASSVTPEGENTAQYVSKILEPLTKKHSLKISSLGRGLSTGTELEYSDSATLEHALRNRR